eukprot:5158826-Lingulodinium_polyedra.AAC.1
MLKHDRSAPGCWNASCTRIVGLYDGQEIFACGQPPAVRHFGLRAPHAFIHNPLRWLSFVMAQLRR